MTKLFGSNLAVPGTLIATALMIVGFCDSLQAAEPQEQQKVSEALLPLSQAVQRAKEQAKAFEAMSRELERKQEQLEVMKRQSAAREQQLARMQQQMAEQQRRPVLPPLEDAVFKVYHLKHVPAREAAQTIESLFGVQVLRLAVDERINALIMYGTANELDAADALLGQLDAQAAPKAAAEQPTTSGIAAPRSLLLRVFWLADGLPEGEGEDPGRFLPGSVLAATEKLGLTDARLVTQTVNSLVGADEAVEFSTRVPAFLFKQPGELACEGRVKLIDDARAALEMKIEVAGASIGNELMGSLAIPLGHYMVLGTANSVVAPRSGIGGGMGMGGRMMGTGRGESRGGFRRGFGDEVEFAGEMEADMMAADQPPAEPRYSTSRFAFVVQVIEGESYPAESSTPSKTRRE